MLLYPGPVLGLCGVPLVTVGHGPRSGELEVSRQIVSWSTFPIEEYQVALSYEGPVSEATWSAAEILGRFPWHKGRIMYREVFGDGVPIKMLVSINPALPDLRTVTEICLHECCHTLGRPEPIHPDERRAVAAVRGLPQGQDNARYLTSEAPAQTDRRLF